MGRGLTRLRAAGLEHCFRVEASPLVGTAQVATIYPAGVVGLPSSFLFHILQGILLIPSLQMRKERL